jgi:hypothetical protein
MGSRQTADPFRSGDEAEKADSRRSRFFEGADRGGGAAAGCEHRVEHEEVPLGGVARHLEVVVHRLERVVVTVQSDVPDACRGDESGDSLDHAESSAQDRDERQLLSANLHAGHPLEGCVDRYGLECQIARRLVRHEHCDLVDQLLEVLGRSRTVAKHGELVLHERVCDQAQRRERSRRGERVGRGHVPQSMIEQGGG